MEACSCGSLLLWKLAPEDTLMLYADGFHWLDRAGSVVHHRPASAHPGEIFVHLRGRKVAMDVARVLVVYLERAGGQSQYSALLASHAQSDSDVLSELEKWIAEHLKSDLRIETLAERVHMSPRNFARLYSKTRGRTPAKAVEAIRIDAARRPHRPAWSAPRDRIGHIHGRCLTT